MPPSVLADRPRSAASLAVIAALGAAWVPLLAVLPPLPGGVAAAWPWLALVGAIAVAVAWPHVTKAPMIAGTPRSRLVGRGAGYAATLLLFAWPLAALWHGETIGHNVTLGWLPLADSRGYEDSAFKLWLTGELDGLASQRPLFPAVLAALFAWFDGAVRPAQIAFVWVSATASWLAGRTVAETHGGPAGLLVVTFLAAAAHQQTGALLTEQIGLPLGALGFALIWTAGAGGAARPPDGGRRLAMLALGMATVALALNARAGAFFVLPALCLWVAFAYRRQSLRRALIAFAVVVTAGLSAFAANSLLYRSLGNPDVLPFGNFAPSLYGVVVGNEGWTQVYRDHPTLTSDHPTSRELYREIYRLSWDAAQEAPLTVLAGIADTYNRFVIELDGTEMFVTTWARLAAMGLIVAGVWICWRRRRAEGGVLLAAALGIFASVPMLPDGGPRVFAATHAWSAALMALGAVGLTARLNRRSPVHGEPGSAPSGWPTAGLIAAATVLVAVVAAAPLVAGRASAPSAAPVDCPDGLRPALLMARPVAPVTVADSAGLPDALVAQNGFAGNPAPPFAVTRVWDSAVGSVVWLVEPGPEAATLARLADTDLAGCLDVTEPPARVVAPLTPLAR